MKIYKHAADILLKLTDLLKGAKVKNDWTKIVWSKDLITSYKKSNQALSDVALLWFLSIDGKLVLHSDANEIAIGATLSLLKGFNCKPLGFFSRMLSNLQTKYSSMVEYHFVK